MTLLSLAACQATGVAPASTPLPTNTDAFAEITDEEITDLLFRAEDFGWPADSYVIESDKDDPAFDQFEPLQVINANATARSNPVNPKTGSRYRVDPLFAGQSVTVYKSEQDAIDVFDAFASLGLPISAYEPASVKFEPKVDRVLWGCRDSPQFRSQYCNVDMQYGRYMIVASMGVDGEIVTFADFEKFINLIQDRLLAHVAAE